MVWEGWQDDFRRHWCLSVGFTKRSVSNVPVVRRTQTSKKGISVPEEDGRTGKLDSEMKPVYIFYKFTQFFSTVDPEEKNASKYRHCRTINFCVVRGTESKNVFNKNIYLFIIIILFVRIARMRSQILAVLIVGLYSRSRKSLQAWIPFSCGVFA